MTLLGLPVLRRCMLSVPEMRTSKSKQTLRYRSRWVRDGEGAGMLILEEYEFAKQEEPGSIVNL